MQTGQSNCSNRPLWLTGLLLLAAGCASPDRRLEEALNSSLAGEDPVTQKNYHINCPDVVEVQVAGPHPWKAQSAVGPDGRIPLLAPDAARVEGLTPAEASTQLATQLHVKPDQVQVKVAAFKSHQIYIFGEVAGSQRAVPYQGPETIVELLQRAGGLGSGAAPNNIQVVRTHVADGKQPEVFQIDLPAILLKHDNQTNIRLEPFDQVYVGQSTGCLLSRCLPPWLRSCCNFLNSNSSNSQVTEAKTH
jgi:protein involved in polysaccharide export with SLBB domain